MKVKPTAKRGNRKMATEKPTGTKAQQAKKLIEQANALIEEAKQEQLTIITAAIGELRELGFTYSITEAGSVQKQPAKAGKAPGTGKTPSPKVAPGPSANFEADKTCSVCHIPGHDARKHRVRKDVFTPAELAELGLQSPDAAAATA